MLSYHRGLGDSWAQFQTVKGHILEATGYQSSKTAHGRERTLLEGLVQMWCWVKRSGWTWDSACLRSSRRHRCCWPCHCSLSHKEWGRRQGKGDNLGVRRGISEKISRKKGEKIGNIFLHIIALSNKHLYKWIIQAIALRGKKKKQNPNQSTSSDGKCSKMAQDSLKWSNQLQNHLREKCSPCSEST